MFSHSSVYCSKGSLVTNLCSDKNCLKPAFLCQYQYCECHEGHQNCQNTNFKNVIDKIIIKINHVMGPLENLVLYYDELMKIVLIAKNELLDKLDKSYEMVYEEEQSKFLEAIQKGITVTGAQVVSVVQELEKQNISQQFGSLLKSESLKTRKVIEQGLHNVKRIWRKKKKVTIQQTKNKLRQCEVRYIMTNGKWNKPLQISSSFRQIDLQIIEGYDLNNIDQTTILGLAFHCPKLKRLQIGVASSYSNVNDQCCQLLADQLKNLQVLKIHHSNVTDKGAITIAIKLRQLSELQICECNLTQQGKQRVKNSAYQCQKIKL